MATDLWPDFKIEQKTRGVRQVLDEAGEELKQKTAGLIEFRARLHQIQRGANPTTIYTCNLYVPKIDYVYSDYVYVRAPLTGATRHKWALKTGQTNGPSQTRMSCGRSWRKSSTPDSPNS
jgi:hypothetical protein